MFRPLFTTISKIFIFVLLINIFTLNSSANAKFLIEQNIIYQVNNELSTLVTKNITLTNLENDVIATSYSFDTNYIDIYDIQGYENDQLMAVKKDINNSVASLTATLNDVSIGKGSTKSFTIKYKTNEIVTKSGEIININIPKAKINSETTLYNVQLIVPNNIGNKLFISPSPSVTKQNQDGNDSKNTNDSITDTVSENDNSDDSMGDENISSTKLQDNLQNSSTTSYFFTKQDLQNTGITASFGENQILNFKLNYQLQNDGYFNSVYEVALPNDIKDYQQISIKNLNPKPSKIHVDKDNNLIATYNVKAKSQLQIQATGSVKLTTKQINIDNGGEFADIPNNLKGEYTKSEKYWESDLDVIKNIAENLYLKDQNVSKNAKQIYDYLVNNFEYNLDVQNQSYIDRKGAAYTITSREAIACMEFTDTFVAIARAMGIPAKEINGYAIAQDNNPLLPTSVNFKNGDLLHSWPMYYDPNFGWVQIDPTWGNTSKMDYFTKLDTNHFALVIRGINSEYPLPAGMYRTSEETKLLNIDFANKNEEFITNITAKKVFNFSPIHFLLGYNRYEITNTGNTIVYDVLNKNYLLPGQKTNGFIKKQNTSISFKDISDTVYNISL